MNKKQLLASALVIMMTFAGCKKAAESVIDCFSESVLVSVHVSVNATNAKQINTEVRYSGSKKVTGVKWEYGDGGTESTTALTGSHTYNSAGNYTIKARVTFTNGKGSCEVDPTRSVTIQ